VAENKVAVGLDASGAQVGADEYRRACDTIKAANAQLIEQMRSVDKSFDEVNKRASSGLVNLGESFKRAAATIAGSGGNLRAGLGSLSGDVLSTASNAEGMAKALGLSAGAVGPLAAVAAGVTAVGGALAYGTVKAFELEHALSHLAARTPTGNVQPYEDAALKLSKTLGVDAVQAAQTFEAAAFAGISKFTDQVNVAGIALKLFKTEGTDAAQAVQLIDAALDAYNKPSSEAADVTDQLLSLAKSGETKFADMAAAIAAVGPKAKGLNIDMVELGSVLAALAPKSGGALNAASSLSQLLIRLSDPTSQLTKDLAAQGIIFDVNTVKAKGLGAALADLARQFVGKEDKLAEVFGNPRVAQAAFVLIEDGGKRVKAASDAAKTSTGELGEGFEKTEALGSAKWEKLVVNVKSGLTEMTEGLKGLIGDLFDLPNAIASLGDKTEAAFKSSVGKFEVKNRPSEFFSEEDIKRLDEARAKMDAVGDSSKVVSIRAQATSDYLKGGFTEFSEKMLTVDRDQLRALDEAIDKQKTLTAEKRAALGGDVTIAPEDQPALRPIKKPDIATLIPGEKQGPEIEKGFEESSKAAKDLANTLDEKLAASLKKQADELKGTTDSLDLYRGALQATLAIEEKSLRSGEEELQKKIELYEKLGIPVDDLKAKLFLLAAEDDRQIALKRELVRVQILDYQSSQRTAEAKLHQGQAIHSLNDATALYVQGLKEVVKFAELSAKQDKAFKEGPEKFVEDFKVQTEAIGKTADEQERLTTLRQYDDIVMRLQEQGMTGLNDKFAKTREELIKQLDSAALKRKAAEIGHAIADPISQGLENAVFSAGTAKEKLNAIVNDLMRSLFRTIITNPLNQALSGLLAGLFGPKPTGPAALFPFGFPGFAMGGVPDSTSNYERGGVPRTGYAMGGVPEVADTVLQNMPRRYDMGGLPQLPPYQAISQQPMLRFESGGVPGGYEPPNYATSGVAMPTVPFLPHASGGIVEHATGSVRSLSSLPDLGSQPSLFQMAGGKTGSIREYGKPEGIFPLVARGPSGRLGIELVGQSQRNQQPVMQSIDQRRSMNVTFNLSDRLDARSRRQIVSDLDRASKKV